MFISQNFHTRTPKKRNHQIDQIPVAKFKRKEREGEKDEYEEFKVLVPNSLV